jgi:hypothetical protein
MPRTALSFVAQLPGDGQHHVLLAQPGGADGAGVFAAVAGVERDDDQPVDACAVRRRSAGAGSRGAGVDSTGADAAGGAGKGADALCGA